MSDFYIDVMVESYCKNSMTGVTCDFYKIKAVETSWLFFKWIKNKKHYCVAHKQNLQEAIFPYVGVVLPCVSCLERRKLLDYENKEARLNNTSDSSPNTPHGTTPK